MVEKLLVIDASLRLGAEDEGRTTDASFDRYILLEFSFGFFGDLFFKEQIFVQIHKKQ
jgi:hypothetical protein